MEFAPLRNRPSSDLPWHGSIAKKPWEYPVTVAIPVLDHVDLVEAIIEAYRAGTVKPYIMLIDTGSLPHEFAKLAKMRAPDVEVHQILLNSTPHASDLPAMACDLSFTLCRTDYLFCTHSDVFPRRKDLLQHFLHLAKNSGNPAIGYELTERDHSDWQGMISHTASLFEMKVMDQMGAGWSMRRLLNSYGVDQGDVGCNSWPDTEILINYVLRHFKIKPLLIGKEENFKATKDENIYHARSLTCSSLYSKEYYKKAMDWRKEAYDEVWANIAQWRQESLNTESCSSTPVPSIG